MNSKKSIKLDPQLGSHFEKKSEKGLEIEGKGIPEYTLFDSTNPSQLSIPPNGINSSSEREAILPKELTSDQSFPLFEKQIEALKPKVDLLAKKADTPHTQEETEILQKYIALKEVEVRDLKEQQKHYQVFIKNISEQYKEFRNQNHGLLEQGQRLQTEVKALRHEAKEVEHRHQKQMTILTNDFEEKLKVYSHYEIEMKDAKKRQEEWQQKVKEELNRIKLKEKEIENKYELYKHDTQALLDSKDKQLVELNKKNNALTLTLESFEEKLRAGQQVVSEIESKKNRLLETLKLSLSLIDELDKSTTQPIEK